MASLRDQIDEIKSKIKFSDELSKYVNVVSKGSDLWCLCLYHNVAKDTFYHIMVGKL